MESNTSIKKQPKECVFVDLFLREQEILMKYNFQYGENHQVTASTWEEILLQMDLLGIGKDDMALICYYGYADYPHNYGNQYLYSEFKPLVESNYFPQPELSIKVDVDVG